MDVFNPKLSDLVHTTKNRRDDWTQSFYRKKEWVKIAHKRKKYARHYCEWHYQGNPDFGLPGGQLVSIVGKQGVVHHIKDLRTHPELGLDWDNLVAICHMCHSLAHPEKLAKMHTRKSKSQKREEVLKKTKSVELGDLWGDE